jgi:hypothetical protein
VDCITTCRNVSSDFEFIIDSHEQRQYLLGQTVAGVTVSYVCRDTVIMWIAQNITNFGHYEIVV